MSDDAITIEAPEEPDETTRVAQYGCLRPLEGSALIDAQMRAARDYYNGLIALERTRRVVYREIRRAHCPKLDALETRVNELAEQLEKKRDEIKALRKEARARAATKALDAEAAQLRTALREARGQIKQARAEAKADPALAAEVAQLDERGKVWHRAMRATTTCYWGTYLVEEQSFAQARGSVVDPSFRRARGTERVSRAGYGGAEGQIAVQLQGGLDVATLRAGTDTRLRLVDAPAELTGSKRRSRLRLLYIRVGSDGRSPVWAVVPLVYHRPLPADARITWCKVQRRVQGLRERWYASITYSLPSVPMPMRSGVVALDLGWRKRRDASLRVAYWADDQGRHGEVLMPARVRSRLRHASDLREIQDRHFVRVKRGLLRWLSARDRAGQLVPDWLASARAWLAPTNSHARLRRLVMRWRDARFARDEGVFPTLERWLHRSRHLYQWEVDVRAKALRAYSVCIWPRRARPPACRNPARRAEACAPALR